jgi:hypothetical protein
VACDETFDSGIEKWDLIVMTYVRVVNGERAARFQRGAQTRRGLRIRGARGDRPLVTGSKLRGR